MAKRCEYCGRYFIPDKRVGNRQRACFRPECKRQRKLQGQKKWKKSHPEVTAHHYEDYVKPWREARRNERRERQASLRPEVIRDKIPPSNPYWELVLLIPEETRDMIRDEIRLRRLDNSTFVAYGT